MALGFPRNQCLYVQKDDKLQRDCRWMHVALSCITVLGLKQLFDNIQHDNCVVRIITLVNIKWVKICCLPVTDYNCMPQSMGQPLPPRHDKLIEISLALAHQRNMASVIICNLLLIILNTRSQFSVATALIRMHESCYFVGKIIIDQQPRHMNCLNFGCMSMENWNSV